MDVSSLHVHPLGDDQADEYTFKRRFGIYFLSFSSFACVLVGFATQRQNKMSFFPPVSSEADLHASVALVSVLAPHLPLIFTLREVTTGGGSRT